MKAILITSSILILLIAALRPLLRGRIDPRIQYALWLAAALRLLIPGNLFTSAYSALALLERADRGPGIVETIGQTPIPAQSYDSARAQVVEEYRRQGVPEAQLTPSDLMAIDTQARELMRGPTLAELAAKCARPLWLGGAAAMALWFGAVNWKLRRRLRGARRIEADCPLPVYVTDALPSPCLCGALRPRIYVTPAALDGPERLRHVLAHELTHYRHRDPWWALVRCACLCLYWFDPLVWWAAALSRQDCELACDEGAIRALGEAERIPYGRTLVGLIAAGRTPLLQTATTMTGGRRRVRERVKLIARRPKTVIALALAAALLVGCAVGCTFSGAPETPLDAQREPQLLDLPSRLNDLPEELGAKVSTQDTESGALATYRLTVPADWEDERFADILSVCSFQKEGFRGWPADGEDSLWEMAAQSDTRYYAIRRWREELYPSGYEYWDVHRDVRAFVEKTLLETEGVEPYSPGQPADTLPARLLDIPEELRADVTALPGGEPTATLNDDFTALAQYWMIRPWADYDETGMGWLLTVYRWDQAQFERYYPELEVTGGVNCFAKDEKFYYVTFRATDARAPSSETGYADTFEAIRAFAEKVVLETEGVEPLAPRADTLLERLRNLPAELQPDVVIREADIPQDGSTRLAVSYWMKLSEEEWAVGSGYLAGVYLWNEEKFLSAFFYGDHSGMTCFARTDDNYYFVITQPTSAAYPRDTGPERYQELFDAVPEFVRETVLAAQGVEPFDPEDALTPAQADIKSVTDAIANAPSLNMALTVKRDDGASAGYIRKDVTDYDSYWVHQLNALVIDFEWEAFPDNIPDDLLHSMQRGGGLTISVPDGPALILHQTDNVIWISHGDGEGTTLYRAVSRHGVPLEPDSSMASPGPYHHLRIWFDEVDIAALRAPSAFIPDDGRSHEDIARGWAEGWEGAMAKAVPGGFHTCTYVDVRDVRVETDWPENMRRSAAQRIGQAVEDFGKTWFPFGYQTVFIPENQTSKMQLMAGSTEDYVGDDAPEGAYIYGRVGYMILTDQGWTCREVGTGW